MSSKVLTETRKTPINGTVWAAIFLFFAAAVLAAAPSRAAAIEGETQAAAPLAPAPLAAAPLAAVVRTIAFSAPVEGYGVNSRFGLRRLSFERRARMHEGLDFAAPSGTPVLSCAEGEVLRTGNSATYGRFVEVRHANGVTSFYAHLSRIAVEAGEVLAAGDRVGAVGSTGRSTGPHLHFEIRRDGQQIDPEDFLGQSFALQDVAPDADGSWDAPAFFASAPVAFGPFRTLTPAFQP